MSLIVETLLGNKSSLRIDYATHEAIKYACKNWHYSKSTPFGKSYKLGVWEDGQFIGAIVFSRPTSLWVAKKHKLHDTEIYELSRVALKTGHKNAVSRMIAIAVKMIKRDFPKLKLLVSFADTNQGHHGGIYQANGWYYLSSNKTSMPKIINGEVMHEKTIYDRYGTMNIKKLNDMGINIKDGVMSYKHLYVKPLDPEIDAKYRELNLPYPKRGKQAMAATSGTATV